MSTETLTISTHELLVQSQFALHRTQRTLGELIGVSERTIQRWTAGLPGFSKRHLVTLAASLYPVDRILAAAAAYYAGETVESLGLVPPPPPPVPVAPAVVNRVRLSAPVVELVAEAIVFQAADALEVSRDVAQRGLLVTLERAAVAGLTLEELIAAIQSVGLGKRPADRAPKAGA